MKFASTLILATAIVTLTAPTLVQADQTPATPGLRMEQTLVERYTSAVQDVILESLKLVGVRYKMGGNDIDVGLDCSSFVQTVFRESLGTQLPRTAREQSRLGKKVELSQLEPGDLVFFNTLRRTFSHVGIYLGDNQFIHAPRAGSEIRVEEMNKQYWMKRFNGARRIISPD